MPKIYDQNRGESPSGGPGHVRMHNRGLVLAIAAILAIIIIVMVYRMARGEEFEGKIIYHEAPAITSTN